MTVRSIPRQRGIATRRCTEELVMDKPRGRAIIPCLLITISVLLFPFPADALEAMKMPTPQEPVFETGEYPNGNAEQLIAEHINQANTQILVASYSISSPPIVNALAHAAQRGVQVRIILDRHAVDPSRSKALYLAQHGALIWISKNSSEFRREFMVIDANAIVRGSYDFCRSEGRQQTKSTQVVSGMKWVNDQYAKSWIANAKNSTSFSTALNQWRQAHSVPAHKRNTQPQASHKTKDGTIDHVKTEVRRGKHKVQKGKEIINKVGHAQQKAQKVLRKVF